MKATGTIPLLHTSRITLFRESRRIDLRNDINENFGATHTWSFSFNQKNPDVRHEEVGAILRAKLLGEGGQYSPTMSRLEWLTLNHFADLSGDGRVGVTLSNWDCSFMKLGNSTIVDGISRLDVTTPQIQVLAGGRIDAPQAGIAKQSGDAQFFTTIRFGDAHRVQRNARHEICVRTPEPTGNGLDSGRRHIAEQHLFSFVNF